VTNTQQAIVDFFRSWQRLLWGKMTSRRALIEAGLMAAIPRACTCVVALCLGFSLLVLPAAAQQSNPSPDDKYPENPTKQENAPSRSARLGRLPIEWIIGPYIPVQEPLEPLSNKERGQIYVRQTFLTAGSYVARAFSAGIDQARGEPHDWGGGFAGYGRRYAARYGEFVVQNSIVSGGNALLGYEPRYDFCRCNGFWPRTRHAISRNFVAYNRTERELRPQIPTYTGAFAVGSGTRRVDGFLPTSCGAPRPSDIYSLISSPATFLSP